MHIACAYMQVEPIEGCDVTEPLDKSLNFDRVGRFHVRIIFPRARREFLRMGPLQARGRRFDSRPGPLETARISGGF